MKDLTLLISSIRYTMDKKHKKVIMFNRNKIFVYNPKMMDLHYLENPSAVLKEGLICSYPIDKVIKILSRNFNLEEIDFSNSRNAYGEMVKIAYSDSNYFGLISRNKGCNGTETIWIVVPDDDKGLNRKTLDRYLVPSGYFCSDENTTFYDDFENGVSFVWLIYEKKFDLDVTKSVKVRSKYLYHVCPEKYVQKILIQGLKPKSSEWNDFIHRDRLYFYLDVPDDAEIADIEQEKGKCRLLKIDVSKINDVSFYLDCRKNDAVYCVDSVSPEAISV